MRMRIWARSGFAEHEQLTAESCYLQELCNTPEDAAVSVARARVLPGVTTQLHRLKGIDERYLIISGMGEVELDRGPPRSVQAGDVVYIPQDTPQRIANVGGEDLIFLCVCTPRFDWQHYVALN